MTHRTFSPKAARRTVLGTLAGLAVAPVTTQAKEDRNQDVSLDGSSIRNGYIEGPFGQIHYRTAGDGIPLILCHQSTVSSEMYQAALIPLARRGIKAVALDTPGYGMSARPPGQPTISDYAKIFAPVLAHFGFASANFLGHHTGAYIVCDFAHRFPSKVRTVTLGAPAVFHDENGAPIRDFPNPELPALKSDGSHILALWQRRQQYTRDRNDLPIAHRYFCSSLLNWDNFFDGNIAAVDYQIRPALRSFDMPTMVLTGKQDGQFTFNPIIREIRPDFRFVAIDNASGYIVDEQTEAWVDAVADFVI